MNTSEPDWSAAVRAALLRGLEAFVNPADEVVSHEHGWELSEANDTFFVWECLDCRALKAVAGE